MPWLPVLVGLCIPQCWGVLLTLGDGFYPHPHRMDAPNQGLVVCLILLWGAFRVCCMHGWNFTFPGNWSIVSAVFACLGVIAPMGWGLFLNKRLVDVHVLACRAVILSPAQDLKWSPSLINEQRGCYGVP